MIKCLIFSADYLTEVPLNETLFSHNAEYQQETVDGDSLETSYNEVDDQVRKIQTSMLKNTDVRAEKDVYGEKAELCRGSRICN
jgi:hypothetical protein